MTLAASAAVSQQQDLQRIDDARGIAVGVVGFNPNEALVTALGKQENRKPIRMVDWVIALKFGGKYNRTMPVIMWRLH